MPAPRPFAITTDYNAENPKITKAYRIFFGLRNQDGTYAIKSVTEDGKREYQAVGSKQGFTTFKKSSEQPSRIAAPSALPLAFHPAGDLLLWDDGKGSFQLAFYGRDHWTESNKLSYPGLTGGTLTPIPNGIGLLNWVPGSAGISLFSLHGKKKETLAAGYTFLCTPSSVPDGKGIVGLINKDKKSFLAYVPLQIPLADVANAWMFAQEEGDHDLLDHKGGLLRDLPEDDQLYSMYESEAYNCGQYDPSTPTRPYLVTTDIFWELLAAAFEGMFIVEERQAAIPAFWKFAQESEAYFGQAGPDSRWKKVFSVLAGMKNPSGQNEEVRSELLRIQKAEGKELSPVIGKEVDYGELKPRGHYAAAEDLKTYFKAFKYLTILAGENLPPDELVNASPEVKDRARSWIAAYNFFIAPSRSPLVWGEKFQPPPYVKPREKRCAFSRFHGEPTTRCCFQRYFIRICPRLNR